MDFNRENFDKLLAQNSDQQVEIRLLHEKVRYLMKKLFGRSSEKLSPDQMELLFEELREAHDALDEAEEKLEELDGAKESRRDKRKPLKERIPEDLPTEQQSEAADRTPFRWSATRSQTA